MSFSFGVSLGVFCSALITVISASTAGAFPLPRAGLIGPAEFLQEINDQLEQALGYDFEGIAGLGNCSGSLVRFENSRDSDIAMMLTNGHCIDTGFPAPGQVIVRKPARRSVTLYNSQANAVGRVNTQELLYGTMTKTDMAIYKLDKSFSEIYQAFSVRPLTISSAAVQVGVPLEIISGYWRRGYSCKVETIAQTLMEGRWTFTDSVRYSRPGCEVIGGTSGSPVIQAGSRNVIAVNNTINESGGRWLCATDNVDL